MRKGDIVAFISEHKVIHARIFDWNGNLQSHVKLVDGKRNTYKPYPWECYEAEQFTRDGRVLMTEAEAVEVRAATAFLDEKHERKTFADLFNARASETRHADGRITRPSTRDPYLMGPAATFDEPTEHGKLEQFDLPTQMVQQGLGSGVDANGNPAHYVCKTGMTMHHQLEEYIDWVEYWEPREQRALELLEARSPKQAAVWRRCIKGNWHGLTESQVAVAREWDISPQAVHNLKRKAEAFMIGYLGEDPRRFYASFDPGKAA